MYKQILVIAVSLGFIRNMKESGFGFEEFYPPFRDIATIRNRFAHRIGYKLNQNNKEVLLRINKWFDSDVESCPKKIPSSDQELLEFTKRAMILLTLFATVFTNPYKRET